MDKFEAFLMALLKAVFNDYPYNEERAKASFEQVMKQTHDMEAGENNGF